MYIVQVFAPTYNALYTRYIDFIKIVRFPRYQNGMYQNYLIKKLNSVLCDKTF